MKIELEQKEKQFEPFKIEITIESVEECKSLLNMCLYNESIPTMMGCDHYRNVQTFLNELSSILHKKV